MRQRRSLIERQMSWKDFYDEKNWTARRTHAYARREVWFPLAHAVCSWEDEFHTLMLHDHVRMAAFRGAIRQAVGHLLRQRAADEEPIRILDVGTGYGILAFWAAEAAGDRELVPNANPGVRVYAVEANPVTHSRAIRELSAKKVLWEGAGDPANKILVFNIPSYRLNRALVANRSILERFDPQFPKSAAFPLATFDLIVSETLGNIGDNEDGIRLLQHAALNYLKPDGHVIPAEVTSYLVPIADVASTPASVSMYDSVSKAATGGVKTVSAEYRQKLPSGLGCFDMVYDAVIPRCDYLSKPQKVHSWRLAPQQITGPKEFNYKVELPFDSIRDGRFIGFKGFFTAVLVPEGLGGSAVTLDIESDDIDGRQVSDCWKHCYLPIAKPIDVAPGDRIVTSFRRSVKEPKQESFTYTWHGEIECTGKAVKEFTQTYTADTPFHHATDPVGRFLRSFGVGLEWKHFAKEILPDDAEELTKLLQAAMKGRPPREITLPWELDEEPTPTQMKEMDGPISNEGSDSNEGFLSELSSKLEGCSLGFRFGERESGDFLWVTPEQRLSGPPDGPGWQIRYVVDENFEEGRDFVSVVRLPYTKQLWEEWRKQTWEATTNDKRKTPTFAASLVIPARGSDPDLRLAGDDELLGLMGFLQVHVFTSIIVRQAEDWRSNVQAGVMTHELKQRAESLAQFWLIDPQKELVETIAGLTPTQWAHQPYSIVPYPELITATGQRIILWAFHDKDPTLVFPDGRVPETLHCLIETCWRMCLEDAQIAAVVDLDLNNEEDFQFVEPRYQWIESVLKPCLDVTRCPNMRTEFDGESQQLWMTLTRWLASAFTDYMRHGHISNGGLRVAVEMKQDRLCLSVQDKERTNNDALRRTALWFINRIKSSGPQGLIAGPESLVARGKKIKMLLARHIDADYRCKQQGDDYEDYLEVMLERGEL